MSTQGSGEAEPSGIHTEAERLKTVIDMILASAPPDVAFAASELLREAIKDIQIRLATRLTEELGYSWDAIGDLAGAGKSAIYMRLKGRPAPPG